MVGVDPGGGSLALAELIDEHGAALYADFQSAYGLNLTDVLFDRSPREVLALVEGLPDTSRFVAHIQGGDEKWRDFIGWGRDRHMFADWLEVYVSAHTDKGKPRWSYPHRPTAEVEKKQGMPLLAIRPRHASTEGDS